MPKRKSTLLLVIPLIACFGTSSPAERPNTSGMLLSDVSHTVPGGPIAVRLATPFTNAADECELLRFLNQPHTLDWDTSTPLVDVVHDLSQHVNFQIDYRALEEIGIRLAKSERSTEIKPTPPADPFASRNRKIDARKSTKLTSVTTEKWWQSTSKNANRTGVTTNSARLFVILDERDLTLAQRSGQWLITTVESSEISLDTRMYDVTPIKLVESTDPVHGIVGPRSMCFNPHSSRYRDSTIMERIEQHINSDTWEALGGPSTMSIVILGDRNWLVVSTRTTIHWQIEALLSQLNHAM